MGHFTTKGKLYSEDTDLVAFGSLDVTVTATGTTVQQEAPPVLLDSNGISRSFLYWDTGRRITGKRKVRWTFNHPTNWSEWPAAAYYGIPPEGSGGTPHVTVDAHRVGTGSLDPTPIDGPGSTFVNAPGGTPVAWPGNGNDHLVLTQWGAASIHAKNHLQQGPGDPLLDFSSWQQLTYGGDPTGYFEENDDDITSGSGITGIANSSSPFFPVPHNNSSFLMAGYVVPVKPSPDIFKALLELIRTHDLTKFIDRGDPSPEDIVRLKLISESLDVVRGGTVTDFDTFEGLLGAAKKMTPDDLKRTIAGTKATLRRGQAALKTLEVMAKQMKPRK